jgi:hypothetical protein
MVTRTVSVNGPGLKALSMPVCIFRELNRLREKARFQAKSPSDIPQGLKPMFIFSYLRHD